MLNAAEIYEESGRRCAIARNQSDESRARFETDWLNRALRYETPEDRVKAREIFNAAYKLHRRV